MEFKVQATGGTHFIATNQVANVGAVAMAGTLQFAQQVSAEEKIDFDEPQFFSISIDKVIAFIKVHWLSREAKNRAFCCHMKHLQSQLLDVDGLKAVDRAIKNILNYGVNERLAKICGDLDMYGEKDCGDGHHRQKVIWRRIRYQRSSNRGRHGKGKIPTRSQTGDKRAREA